MDQQQNGQRQKGPQQNGLHQSGNAKKTCFLFNLLLLKTCKNTFTINIHSKVLFGEKSLSFITQILQLDF